MGKLKYMENTWRKLVPGPLHPLQISLGMVWDWNPFSVVKRWWIAAGGLAWLWLCWWLNITNYNKWGSLGWCNEYSDFTIGPITEESFNFQQGRRLSSF